MKFVFFGSNYEATSRSFDDIKCKSNVQYMEKPVHIDNKLLWLLYGWHTGKLKRLPLKFLWNMTYEKIRFERNDTICFVYFNPWISIFDGAGYIKKLKRRYPNSYHIAYFSDIHAARRFDMEILKTKYDYVYIFDKAEAEVMNILAYPLCCSKRAEVSDFECKKDIVFVGQAKDRHDEIIRVYNKLSANGVTCDFYLVGVPLEEQVCTEGVEYGGFLSYDEAISRVLNAKCLLEIKVGNCTSFSNRIYEAIVYNKRILTNNKNILEHEFYDENNIQYYDCAEDINIDFFKDCRKVEYRYRDEYSPVHLLEEFEQRIMKRDCYK